MAVQGIKIAKRHEQETALAVDIQDLKRLKQIAEDAKEAFEEAQALFVKEMEALNRKTLTNDDTKVTVVSGSTTKYDERGLAKALGAPLWNKITKKSLDKAKLEDLVNDGTIDINVVAQHATVTPSKPFVRFSAVLPDDNAS